MVGDEQKKAFQEIAQHSYKELFGEVKVERAVPDDLVNFFIRKYSFTRDKAINAAKFFLYLTEKGAIQVSTELGAFLAEKSPSSQSQTNGSQLSSTRLSERYATRPSQREIKTTVSPQARQLFQRKNGSSANPNDGQPVIQAVISIKLDKDTPREYWDRVLALIGEKKGTTEVQIETTINNDTASDSQFAEAVDQELSPDSNFT